MSESLFFNHVAGLVYNYGAIALDIGANHGTHTSKLACKFGKVYAFEPHPENIEVLKKLDLKNVEIVPKAVSSHSGVIDLYVNKGNPGGHTINADVGHKSTWGHGGGSIKVEAVSIDDFCKDMKIDLIKMDIESAENYVWEGAAETLKCNKLDIFLEVHQTVDSERLRLFFESFGYKWYDGNGLHVTGVPPLDSHYLITNK